MKHYLNFEFVLNNVLSMFVAVALGYFVTSYSAIDYQEPAKAESYQLKIRLK